MKHGLAVAWCAGAALIASPASGQSRTCYLVVVLCNSHGQNCQSIQQEIPCPTTGNSHARFDRPNVPSKRGVAVREGSRCTFKSKGAHAQTIQGTVHGDSCDLDSPVR